MELSVFSTSQMVYAAHVASQKHLCKLEDLSISITSYGLFDDHYHTIDTDYRVVVSTSLQEITETPYYMPLHGQKLRLPERAELWPRQELLEGHREAFKG